MTQTTTPADLTTATPVEVDTALHAIYQRMWAARDRARAARARAADYRKSAERGTYLGVDYAARAANYDAAAEAADAEAEAAASDALPYEAEFSRRGGWTRAFLVLTSGRGHVHSSMACSTCYPTTAYHWVTDYSGHDQAEIIAAAGSDACTICYPNAPVTAQQRARSMWAPSEIEAEERRQERAAAKAERDAAKAAKAITDLDGSPLTVGSGRWSTDRLDTLAAAKSYLTDGFQWGWDHPSFAPADRDRVAAAVAAKVGTTTEVEVAAAEKRATGAVKRAARGR